ncbi:unnamed protein product, partial [Didymodactylos carnosus]
MSDVLLEYVEDPTHFRYVIDSTREYQNQVFIRVNSTGNRLSDLIQQNLQQIQQPSNINEERLLLVQVVSEIIDENETQLREQTDNVGRFQPKISDIQDNIKEAWHKQNNFNLKVK